MIYGIDKLQGVHPYLWAGMGYLGYKSKYDWKVTSAVRDSSKQASLYALGRDESGNVVDVSAVVTDAPAGTSAHEFGLAIDAYPTLDGGKSIVLDTSHPAFAEKSELLKALPFLQTDVKISSGLDRPHIQLRDWQAHKTWRVTFASFAILSAFATLFVLTRS